MSLIQQPYHDFHLVKTSPWSFTSSFSIFFFVVGLTSYFHSYIYALPLIFLGFLNIIFSMSAWWRDVVREATFEGKHTKQVQRGLKNGTLLFIISELMFFFGFFWSFFHSALAPTPEIGSVWPPLGIETVDALGVPLLNTIILLSSGATITWAHHALVFGDRKNVIISLILTLGLAILFTSLQIFEYIETTFSLSTSVYGSVFFMATGFHGFHVLIGSIFILICLIRFVSYHFTDTHHVGFIGAIWYWHFVDVIWLFLFITVYFWSNDI